MSSPDPSSASPNEIDYTAYYSLERYLFETVHGNFHRDGSIGAFDFFSIVIWKANRAKSKVAKRMLRRAGTDHKNLDQLCRDLTAKLFHASNAEARLRIMIVEYGFRLPMATAILTVLWPEEFGVYDVRVCEQLGAHQNLGNKTRFDPIWTGYAEYLRDVRRAAPAGLTLRDMDRYLWGRSAAVQLVDDIRRGFADD